MCDGVAIFSNNKKAFHTTGTSSHSDAAQKLKIDEDHYMKSEYHWWDKSFVPDHYDEDGIQTLKSHGVDIEKATNIAKKHAFDSFKTQKQLVKWLKETPSEWGRLVIYDKKRLAKLVNPKLVLYQDKLAKFKKTKIGKYNPYQATKIPSLKEMKKRLPAQVGDQVWDQVWDQVRAQVWDQAGAQVWDQVGAQVWDQVGAQVRAQVGAQVMATSYWAIKVTLGLPIKHWFFDFLKLGVMVVFVQGKVKVFGKKGKFLGEYDKKDFE